MTTVGIVSALAAEARPLGLARIPSDTVLSLPSGALVCVAGMGAERARAAARGLIAAGAQALVSFGLAGGLDPRVRPGSVVLPQRIVAEGAPLETSADWRDALARTLGAGRLTVVSHGTMLASMAALVTPAAKADAFARTGAQAVDMESYGLLEIAAAVGVPGLVVRVVVDAAEDALPPVIARAALQGSTPGPLQVLRGVLAEPGNAAGVLVLARRYRLAMRALRRIGRSGALWRSVPDATPSAACAPVGT